MLEVLESRLFLSRTWFVSPSGSDQSAGTISQPFKTIQHAAALAEPGDTVYLRAGTYRETVTPAHSGTSSAPITYSAYNNKIVTIDGADPITGWSGYSTSKTIFGASQPFDLGGGNNEVFVDGKVMNEAQWPNTAIGAVKPATATIASVYPSAIGTADGYADTATISIAGLPGGPTAWVGATIHFGGGQDWNIQTGTVLAATSSTLTFAYQHQTNWESPEAGNPVYLTGKFNALDAAGEWYRDPTTGKLYLWTPKGDNPSNHVVEAKHRQYAFELSGLSYINIRNIHIFAASIDTNSHTAHVNISGITANYVSQQMINPVAWINDGVTTGIILLGANNILQNSTIQFSSGNGVYLGGSNNIVEDCTIANVDYSGVDEAGITLVGPNNQILSCSIHDSSRDGILDSNSTNARIEFNKIYNIGDGLTTDLGAIYDFGTDSHRTVIAFNTISNVHSAGFGGGGVYCDNGSADYIIHNNTISGVDIPIKLNPPSYSNDAYDNTINGKLVAKTPSAGGSPASGPITFKGTSANLTTLGTLGGFRSNGLGINNAGEVVGTSTTGGGETAFSYSTRMNAISGARFATAVNSTGQIAGSVEMSNGLPVAHLDSGGKITTLGFLPGDITSAAYALNASGQVAGISFGSDGIGNAFLYSGGTMKALGTLGGHVSEALGINNAGTVVGSSSLPGDRDQRAFSYAAGTMKDLGTLGGTSSYALAINAAGQIAGSSLISGDGAFRAFLYSGGVMHNLGTLPGFKNSVATGIDSAGDVVGYAYNSDTSQSHAFLYRKGVMTDLNNLIPKNTGWLVLNATGINDNDQITGSVVGTSDLHGRAYLLTLLK